MTTTMICVLAAGGSTRFGRPKQRLKYDGEPLVRRAVRVAVETGAGRVAVIWGSVPLDELLMGMTAELIENPHWQEGIASSIRCGVKHAGAVRILFTVADQPRVTSEHLRAILSADSPIVATGYRGIAGVPAAFAPEFHGELLALEGDHGAKRIIEAHPSDVAVIPFEGAAIDIDREEDVSPGEGA